MLSWMRVMSHAGIAVRPVIAVLTLMLIGVGVNALKPWPIKLLIDHVLSTQFPQPTWMKALFSGSSPSVIVLWIALATVLLFVIGQLTAMTQGYVQSGLGHRLAYQLGAQLFSRLQALSLTFHHRRQKGDLVRRVMTDSGSVRDLLVGFFIPSITAVASLVIMLAIMWRMDRALALIAIGFALPLGLIMRWLSPRMNQRSYDQQALEGELISHAERTLSAMPMVQSFVREQVENRRFRDLSGRTHRASIRALATQLQFKMFTGAVTAAGTATVIVVGGWHALDGRITVGELLVFLSYLASLYAPMETLSHVSISLATSAAGARRVLEVLESPDQIQESSNARTLRPISPESGCEIRFDRVTFSYEPERPVLHAVDLTIARGAMVALVGPTGAGKSTLVSLIPRLFDPQHGRVLIDGMDVREMTLSSLRENIAVVPQDPLLLPITVAENIAYGRPDASLQEIIDAAEAANAAPFIEQLPLKYDTVLGERGASLSGGQRQRLAIARALLRNSPILILDEPVSAVDTITERLLTEALNRVRAGRTCLIIAHRLSTAHIADRVVVLKEGHIAEQGSHRELVFADGLYARLHRVQSGGIMQSPEAVE